MPIPADVLVATLRLCPRCPERSQIARNAPYDEASFVRARDRGRRGFAANFETALISIDRIRGAADCFGNTRSDAASDTGARCLTDDSVLLRAIRRYLTSQGRFATGASYPRRG
jgi:hypothetical protein